MGPPAGARDRIEPHVWRISLVVIVGAVMSILDTTIVNIALDSLSRDLHSPLSDIQWVATGYMLALAAVIPVSGWAAEKVGARRLWIGSVVLFTLGSALCGAAWSTESLIVFRVLQGLGGGMVMPVGQMVLARAAGPQRMGRVMSVVGVPMVLAPVFGPTIGGLLLEHLGWRWIFFVNLPIGVACVLGGARVLHESRDEEHGGFDVFGFVFLSCGLFALVLGLLRGNDWGWSSGRVLGLFAAAAALLLAFVVAEWKQREPMLDLSLFRVPTFAGAQVVAFVISSAMFSQFLYLTLYLQNVLGYSPIAAGVRFLPLSLLSFVAAPIAGRLSARVPVRLLLGFGLVLIGGALLLMHGITVGSGWTTLLAGFLVGGVGIGMVNAPLASTAVSVVPPRRAGMASGINNTFRQVGIATGIAALGAIFQSSIRADLASKVPTGHVAQLSRAVASGATQQALAAVPRQARAATATAARSAFVNGLNEILLVAAFVALAGAVLAFVLVRRQDFVASGAPEAAAAA